jgi:hypothetical protein
MILNLEESRKKHRVRCCSAICFDKIKLSEFMSATPACILVLSDKTNILDVYLALRLFDSG